MRNGRRYLDAQKLEAQMLSMEQFVRIERGAGREADRMPNILAYAASLAMVAASTIVGALIAPRWGNSPVDLLYLPAILASAMLFGLWPALLAGLLSALAFNFFFTPPIHSFRMDRPADIVTAVILFVVAAVTSKLAASVREQAALANAHASRNATIAGFSERLLSCQGKRQIASFACARLSRIFDCNTVLLEGLPKPAVVASAPARVPMTASETASAAAVLEFGESAGRGATRPYPTDWQFHAVRSGDQVLAAVGLVRDDEALPVTADQQELLRSLLDQVALALERARLEQEARDLSSLRERDATRSTLLSSIGRDLKPPIKAISDRIRQLRRSSGDKETAAAIASEVTKLDRYVSNLMELEPAADQLPIEVKGLSIDLAQRRVTKGGEQVHLTPKEFTVLAELAKHPGRVLPHAHLLRTAWGPAQENQTEYLRVAIRALRQKLEPIPTHPEIILNEPAVGYRLAVP